MVRRTVVLAVAVLLFMSMSCSRPVTEVTDAGIMKILDETSVASNERDIDGVMKHLAPEVAIKVTTETPMGVQTLTPDRGEYEKLTERGWFFAGTYTYRLEDIGIDIADDRQSATVTSQVFETLSMNGEMLRSRTDERLKMEILDGKILVTEMEAVVYR